MPRCVPISVVLSSGGSKEVEASAWRPSALLELAVPGAPLRVRWSDDGHEGFFFPGSDAIFEHLPAEASSPTQPSKRASQYAELGAGICSDDVGELDHLVSQ
jgi:hypothetical protein